MCLLSWTKIHCTHRRVLHSLLEYDLNFFDLICFSTVTTVFAPVDTYDGERVKLRKRSF